MVFCLVENRRRAHGSSRYRVDNIGPHLRRRGDNEEHRLHTPWLLAVEKKQIRPARHCRRCYMDSHSLHHESKEPCKEMFNLIYRY